MHGVILVHHEISQVARGSSRAGGRTPIGCPLTTLTLLGPNLSHGQVVIGAVSTLVFTFTVPKDRHSSNTVETPLEDVLFSMCDDNLAYFNAQEPSEWHFCVT